MFVRDHGAIVKMLIYEVHKFKQTRIPPLLSRFVGFLHRIYFSFSSKLNEIERGEGTVTKIFKNRRTSLFSQSDYLFNRHLENQTVL